VSLKSSFSLTLKLSRNLSLKISITYSTVVKYQIFSLLMKKLQLLMNLAQKLEKLARETVEIKLWLISYNFAVRTCISCLLSHQLESNSETDADSSLQL